jgi:hypothetical protein
VAENSAEIGLPEAAQCARTESSLPRDWLEIGESAKRVKEMGLPITQTGVTPATAGVTLWTAKAGFRPSPE